ncbi:hypothetical protein GE107_01560 [Cohnella sp. CFH 77786]|uniref:hypothetical protein n=1 Tax=Cohnella sp. CFH 77786 TaxID=2662265 RepID=UPI001C60D1FB|nr:hypothetical protein [Cohnella sp. CFH 77786]MBW5444752.1 hypothetical protein [Cohnella sp. CFH 77786]
MSKQLLVRKTAGYVEYQLYRIVIPYLATFNNYKGTIIQQYVMIGAYGIAAAIFIGQEEWYYDSGPLAPQCYLVSSLFHYLHRQGYSDLEKIREAIWKEHESWCWNQYGNPFGKIANQKLRKQIRNLVH